MQFIAHRGHWLKPEEKNTPEALLRALAAGYGVETDLRDAGGRLVVSHDPAGGESLLAEDFFGLYTGAMASAPLALNIKADGLRPLLKPMLQRHGIENYFCFDMSVPETLGYQREGFRYFTRESEIEPAPVLYYQATGVWLDMFYSDWLQSTDIKRHLAAGKEVAVVSPELHRRPHLAFWQRLREAGIGRESRIMFCTDFPAEAAAFFHD
jgi:glycerophosphoryl diester phosphodiesterase